jgi:hypothetical protein
LVSIRDEGRCGAARPGRTDEQSYKPSWSFRSDNGLAHGRTPALAHEVAGVSN